jgi:hypothetical protein
MEPEPERPRLEAYLQTLTPDELDEVLNEVLEEVRRREVDEVKRDVLTHSQKLRLTRKLKP